MSVLAYIAENKEWIFSGVGVFVLGLLILVFQQRQRARTKAERRISIFVEGFGKLYKGGGIKLEGLVPSGIAKLKDDKEIKAAFESLMKVTPNHPLRNWKDRVAKVGYKRFFDHVLNSDRELNKESIEDFLGHFERSSKKP